MTWLNEQDKTVTDVVSIRMNSKGSGYIITGIDFDCFAWKKDVLIEHLFVAISTWIEQGKGYALKIEASSKEKRGYTINFKEKNGKKIEQNWYIQTDGFTTVQDSGTFNNPFL